MYLRAATICALLLCARSYLFVTDDVEFTLNRNGMSIAIFDYKDVLERSTFFVGKLGFDPSLPTHIYMHGFQADIYTAEQYGAALFRIGDFNFITVDWSTLAGHVYYFEAKNKINRVSE